MDPSILKYATGWDEAVWQRGGIGIAGFIILALVILTVFKKDSSLIAGLIWFIVGLVMLIFAAIPQDVIRFVIQTEYLTRIRVIMGVLSLFVFLITFESIRRTHLQERYALLWIATALVIFLSALFPQAVDLFRAVTGMEYATAVVAVAFIFLVLIAFHFSTSMSAMQSNHSKIAQQIAMLEARIRDLEEKSRGQK